MCIDRCMAMCADMRIDVCVDVCIALDTDMRIDTAYRHVLPSHNSPSRDSIAATYVRRACVHVCVRTCTRSRVRARMCACSVR